MVLEEGMREGAVGTICGGRGRVADDEEGCGNFLWTEGFGAYGTENSGLLDHSDPDRGHGQNTAPLRMSGC